MDQADEKKTRDCKSIVSSQSEESDFICCVCVERRGNVLAPQNTSAQQSVFP